MYIKTNFCKTVLFLDLYNLKLFSLYIKMFSMPFYHFKQQNGIKKHKISSLNIVFNCNLYVCTPTSILSSKKYKS